MIVSETPALRARGIVKEFGFRRVLDDVSFDLPAGTFLALFGPNGAGKSTLLRILASLARPTSGSVEIGGENAHGRSRARTRNTIGLLSHRTLLYDDLTGLENLMFFAGLYGLGDARARAEAQLRDTGLWARRDDRVGTYSRGMQQRLAIARALIHDPTLLLFDEPFTGLDPAASERFAALLHRLKDGKRSAVLVTHDLPSGLALADRWALLADGRIRAEGATSEATAASIAARWAEHAQVAL